MKVWAECTAWIVYVAVLAVVILGGIWAVIKLLRHL